MKRLFSTLLLASVLSWGGAAQAASECKSSTSKDDLLEVLSPEFWLRGVEKREFVALFTLSEVQRGTDVCSAEIQAQDRFDRLVTELSPLAAATRKDENLNPYIRENLGSLISEFDDGKSAPDLSEKKPLKTLLVRVMDELVETAISITASTGGCVDVERANAYFKELFNDEFVPLEELCIEKNKKISKVSWRWKKSFSVDPSLLPGVSIAEDAPARMNIEKEGFLKFKEKEKSLSVSIDGFSLFLKPEKIGNLKLVNATIKGLSLEDQDGSVKLHLMTMGLVPFSVKLGADKDGNLFAKIFGVNLIKND